MIFVGLLEFVGWLWVFVLGCDCDVNDVNNGWCGLVWVFWVGVLGCVGWFDFVWVVICCDSCGGVCGDVWCGLFVLVMWGCGVGFCVGGCVVLVDGVGVGFVVD